MKNKISFVSRYSLVIYYIACFISLHIHIPTIQAQQQQQQQPPPPLDPIRQFKRSYDFDDNCEYHISSSLSYNTNGYNICGSRKVVKHNDSVIECFFIINDLTRYQSGKL